MAASMLDPLKICLGFLHARHSDQVNCKSKLNYQKKKKIIEILTFFVIPILMPRTKMLISISFLSECLCTNAASIWFLSAMNTFMIFQSIRSMKTFFTCATTITSFITMNQTMLIIN